MKKEIRGMEAVRYAEKHGIIFDDDQEFLLKAEGARMGKTITPLDIDDLFEEQLGRGYDRTDLLPGGESFDFLIGRYGDGWIYVALEGNHPEEEERAVLRLLRGLLKENDPYCGGDLLDLAAEYGAHIEDTGFPLDADTNLLFHAALRLVERGELEAVMDSSPLPDDAVRSYGNRRFFLPPDKNVSLVGLLCGRCLIELRGLSPSLHRECAARLRTALG